MDKQFIIKENMLSIGEYLELRRALDWEIYSSNDISQSLHNSLYIVSIYDNKNIVGAGRIVGDGRICFYIQDVMVRPEYQNKGIGNQIMTFIMHYLYEHAAQNAYIGLMSKIGKSGFYEKYGFISRPNEKMGPGMVLCDLEIAKNYSNCKDKS